MILPTTPHQRNPEMDISINIDSHVAIVAIVCAAIVFIVRAIVSSRR